MGHIAETFPHPDFRQSYQRLTARNLDQQVRHSAPPLSRTGLEPVEERLSWWQSAPIFRDLSKQECEQMMSTAAQRQYAARTVIVQEGDAGAQVQVMASGTAKVSQTSHTGDEVILRIRRPGDVLGGLGMAPGETHSATIRALETCTVLSWRTNEFEQFCACSPVLQRNLLQVMHEALRTLEQCFCDMATLNASSRLARTLLRLGEQNGCRRENARITFTCEELGQMAGTTLFTVSRLLSRWTEMGLLYTENREIVLEDIQGLVAMAGDGPGESGVHEVKLRRARGLFDAAKFRER